MESAIGSRAILFIWRSSGGLSCFSLLSWAGAYKVMSDGPWDGMMTDWPGDSVRHLEGGNGAIIGVACCRYQGLSM